MATRALIPSGALGLGFDRDALAAGIAWKPDIICIDGGSTDSGPFYLGSGTSKYSRASTRFEWGELLEARAAAEVPIVLGSAGTCGTDAMVDWLVDITRDIAGEKGWRLKIATLKSGQVPDEVARALSEGRVTALTPDVRPPLDKTRILECSNIVALAGAEQTGAAISTGADVIIAGRTTDTAVISALPILNGEHAGSAWHGAKITECGALCSTRPGTGVIGAEFTGGDCTITPFAAGSRCTPESVAAHMLYENADPLILHEPGGYLDTNDARLEAIDTRRVRISGSRWVRSPEYRVKLEGARQTGFQTTTLVILRQSRYVRHIREWLRLLELRLTGDVAARTGRQPGTGPGGYSVEFRLLGMDSALGGLENRSRTPVEVGVLGLVVADTQEAATEVARILNPLLLHFPLTDDEEIPTFAFPYAPPETERGQLFEFTLNHVMRLDDPMDAFQLDVMEIGDGTTR